MGQKGDRAAKEPLAIRMYAEGKSIEAIATDLDVSATSLRIWKGQSLAPNADIDEWDRARQQRRGMSQRLKDIYEEQIKYLEELKAQGRTSPMIDALSKLGALVERQEIKEKVRETADEAVKVAKSGGLSAEKAEEIRKKILGIV